MLWQPSANSFVGLVSSFCYAIRAPVFQPLRLVVWVRRSLDSKIFACQCVHSALKQEARCMGQSFMIVCQFLRLSFSMTMARYPCHNLTKRSTCKGCLVRLPLSMIPTASTCLLWDGWLYVLALCLFMRCFTVFEQPLQGQPFTTRRGTAHFVTLNCTVLDSDCPPTEVKQPVGALSETLAGTSTAETRGPFFSFLDRLRSLWVRLRFCASVG